MGTEKKGMDRRTFLKTTGMGSASLAMTAGLGGKLLAAEVANNSSSKAMPTRILGKTGVPVSIPDVLRYMMYYNSYCKTDDARRLFRELPEPARNSLALRDYSTAEVICSNKIEIGKAMREAVRILG